jgi:pilus assembly protein Flp/PilA
MAELVACALPFSRLKCGSLRRQCKQRPRIEKQPLGVNRARDSRTARGGALRRIEMKAFANVISSFVRNEEGQDLLEYALLVALIALVAVGAVTAAGQSVNTIFAQIAAAI